VSYILDALKKSEEERRRGTVPDLLAVQYSQVQGQGKRHWWPYLLLVALVVNAGVLLWWLTPWQAPRPGVSAYPTPKQGPFPERTMLPEEGSKREKSLPAQIAPTGKRATDKTMSQHEDDLMQTDTSVRKQTPAISAPAAESQESHAITRPSSIQNPSFGPSPSETNSSAHSTNAARGMVYNLYELPSYIQQSLPGFSITAHIHTGDPATGMVKVNGQVMREGQELSPGLKLEEIVSDGVIFRYQNYRFRVGLK